MKKFELRSVSLSILYLYAIIGTIISIILIILIIYLIRILFTDFDYIEITFILLSFFFGNYLYGLSLKKASKILSICVNSKKIIIDDEVILIENIKKIKCKDFRLGHYPKLVFYFKGEKKIIRVSKDYDYDKFRCFLSEKFELNS